MEESKLRYLRLEDNTVSMISASYGKTGQLLRVSGAAVPFRTVRSTAMLARSATGEVNTVIYLYPAC